MLYESAAHSECVRSVEPDFVKSFSVLRTALRCEKQKTEASSLLNQPENPTAMFLMLGSMACIVGASEAFEPMFEDLLAGRVEAIGDWSASHLAKSLAWQLRHEKKCSLFLNAVPLEAHEAAISAGFRVPEIEDGSTPAFLYWFKGEPRFAELVRHSCRLGEGLELHELMRRGISYDEEGHYTKMCLENGPSFVCEVDGQPVCWSCTHLNGTMGMIYTPEEHRRRGYAKSLAAFQIDHMLRTEQFACCHVIQGNTASEEMVLGLGATKHDSPICWRMVLWPEEQLPALPEAPEKYEFSE